MTQTLRIVDPFTYTVAILDGAVYDLTDIPDYEPLDATRLDHLRLAFIFPEWPQDLWKGLKAPRPRGTPMTRIGELGHMDSDGVEYEAAATQIVEDKFGHLRIKTMPWRRTSPKRETNSQRRIRERHEAEALANCPQGIVPGDWLGMESGEES